METLFVYGTLYEPDVQQRLIGRTISGQPDSLAGYSSNTTLLDPYPVAIPEDGANMTGFVLRVTTDELVLLDEYEGDCYLRIKVWLQSGLEAWVYVVNPACIDVTG